MDQVTVLKSSRHCQFCGKCVAGFDHHCKWLNTCIGRENYRYFFGTVTGVILFLFVHLTMIAIQLSRVSRGEISDDLEDAFGPDFPEPLYLAILIGSAAVIVTVTLLMLQLWTFHVFLIYSGLTTYEYIMNERISTAPPRSRRRDAQQRPAPQGQGAHATPEQGGGGRPASGSGEAKREAEMTLRDGGNDKEEETFEAAEETDTLVAPKPAEQRL